MNIPRNAPIGIIDSGIGGLSLLKNLVRKYAYENYIYLADNLNMPYGNKSAKFLRERILELVNYLCDTFNVKLVILACNTASLTSLEYVTKHSKVKVIGLDVGSLVTVNTKIVCTKRSSTFYPNLNVCACSSLASNIEENIFDIKTLKRKISNIISKINEKDIILGCTHYELVENLFRQVDQTKNYILPCKEFVNQLILDKPNLSNRKGDILMISTLATKSYIDKLWKIFKS